MLRIVDYDDSNNYRTLRHSDDVFHKALKAVLNGEKHFHVVGAEEKYDLIWSRSIILLPRKRRRRFRGNIDTD